MNEKVMVVKKSGLVNLGLFQGLNYDVEKYLKMINSDHFFIDRKEAENNYLYKQIIPYAILCHKKLIVSYVRGETSGESRLKYQYSVGIGGHINIEDTDSFNSRFRMAMHRELNEEVYIRTKFREHIVALLNDDSNDVGKVHLGIVYLLDLEKTNVYKKEKSIKEVEFKSIEALKKNINIFESWSQICIKEIEKIMKIRGGID